MKSLEVPFELLQHTGQTATASRLQNDLKPLLGMAMDKLCAAGDTVVVSVCVYDKDGEEILFGEEDEQEAEEEANGESITGGDNSFNEKLDIEEKLGDPFNGVEKK